MAMLIVWVRTFPETDFFHFFSQSLFTNYYSNQQINRMNQIVKNAVMTPFTVAKTDV